jgi:methyl-accepting chemotaxis protein
MATKISEDTNVQLDLKTIGIIIAGTISLASMWFTLQGDITDLQNKIDNFSGDEFVQQMEFKFKDELIRTNIVQIDKLTENIKEDVEENKEAIKDLEDKVYKKR